MKRGDPRALVCILRRPGVCPASASAPGLQNASEIPFESVPFLKLTPERNLGEVLSVAVNSKGHVVVLNHPGSAGQVPSMANPLRSCSNSTRRAIRSGNRPWSLRPGLLALRQIR